MFIITKPDNRIGVTAPATPKAAVLICYQQKGFTMLHPPQEDNAVVTRLSEEPELLRTCLKMITNRPRFLQVLALLALADPVPEAEKSHTPERPGAASR
jgi:hypothetical protein